MRIKLLFVFFFLALASPALIAQTNDECTGAVPLTVSEDAACRNEVTGDAAGATKSLGAINCEGSMGIPDDVWYSFVASNTSHIITVKGSADFDAVIDLRMGSCPGVNIACSDASYTGGTSEVLFASDLIVGNTYYVRVYNWSGSYAATSTFTICITTPKEIDSPCDRAKMVNDYNLLYKSSEVLESQLNWTGNTANCDAGEISEVAQQNVLTRINYYRKLVGLPQNISFDPALANKCQEAALMMHANNELSHTPPTTWSCYTADGAQAASKSNIASSHSTKAIDAYINDNGSNNAAVGHRRWILYSKANIFGHGSTSKYDALWVLGTTVPAFDIDYVAYPSAGFFPAPLVPTSNRWSFAKVGADFTNTTIEMSDSSGTPISLTQEPIAKGYGDNTIVWKPTGIFTNSETDIPYTVHVKNVVVSGISHDYTYVVKISQPVYPPKCPEGYAWSENDCACSATLTSNRPENYSSSVYISPNPANNYVNLSFDSKVNIQKAFVTLYDISGRKVGAYTIQSNTARIDLSNINNGLYYIIVEENNKQYQSKIIINK